MRKYVLLIILLILLVYANAPRNGFVWDDEFLIIVNPSITTWKYAWLHFALDLYHSYSNYYRPIQMISYMVDFSIWSLNPFGYHITSVLLHISVVLLLFWWLQLLGAKKEAAFICSSLYAVHPAHTAIVTYIAGRADSLALTFSLLCFIFLYKHFKAEDRMKSFYFYLSSILMFLMALLSKEISIIVPILILFYRLFFIPETDVEKSRDIIKFNYLSWFIIIAGVYIALRSHALNFLEIGLLESKYSLYSRILTFVKSIGIYIGIALFPVNLRMERSISYVNSIFDSGVLLSCAIMILIFVFAIKIRKVSRKAVFGIIFFFIALLPVSNIIPMGNNIAEHWLYMPLVGAAIFTSFYGEYLYSVKNRKIIVSALAVFYLIFFSHQVVSRNFDWYDEWTIYRHTIKHAPQSIKMLNNIGNLYHSKRDINTAMKYHKKAVAVNPREHKTRVNLGIDYEDMGLLDKALRQYELAASLRSDYSKAYFNMGNIFAKKNKFDKAIDCYKTAIKYDELNISAKINLGNIYFNHNLYKDAKKEYQEALNIDAYSPEARKNLAKSLEMLGEYDKALKEYEKVIELYPDSPEYYFDLGTLYGKMGWYGKAIKELKRAHSLEPRNVDTLLNLGATYFHKGDYSQSKKEWEKALRIDPTNKTAAEYIKKLEATTP